MVNHKGLPVLAFPSREHWDAWLNEHAFSSSGIWLKFAKKSSGVSSVSKPELIETALAHGWIDGQLNGFDEQHWLVRFTPRGAKSKWSRINRDTAERLIAEGIMAARGLVEVEKAKNDGRWDAAYEPQSTAKIPEDFREVLDKYPRAKAFFETLEGANDTQLFIGFTTRKLRKRARRGSRSSSPCLNSARQFTNRTRWQARRTG